MSGRSGPPVRFVSLAVPGTGATVLPRRARDADGRNGREGHANGLRGGRPEQTRHPIDETGRLQRDRHFHEAGQKAAEALDTEVAPGSDATTKG